jgi:hypothetical protein
MSNTKRNLTYIEDDNSFVFLCPHCDGTVIVHQTEINCQIFRHAILKQTGEQLNPHATKQECDYLYENQLIYGCSKPFRIFTFETSSNWSHADICDYI